MANNVNFYTVLDPQLNPLLQQQYDVHPINGYKFIYKLILNKLRGKLCNLFG